eukprot:1616845-Amphidinium_carterae.1
MGYPSSGPGQMPNEGFAGPSPHAEHGQPWHMNLCMPEVPKGLSHSRCSGFVEHELLSWWCALCLCSTRVCKVSGTLGKGPTQHGLARMWLLQLASMKPWVALWRIKSLGKCRLRP